MESKITLEMMLKLHVDDLYFISEDLLESYFGNVYSDGGSYIYALGKSPICLVAHIDTVRSYDDPLVLVKRNGFMYNKHGILGADDRAGVYMIYRILSECVCRGIPLPSVLLTNYEEVGMFGATEFVSHRILQRSGGVHKTNLFMGLDRSGSFEYVTYGNYIPINIVKYLHLFGFRYSISRKRSDVLELAKAYDIPTINLSIGYQAEHTRLERLNLRVYAATFKSVLEMVRKPPKK